MNKQGTQTIWKQTRPRRKEKRNTMGKGNENDETK